MKINGVDISKYGAKQWTISPGKRRVSNVSETLEGAVIPVMSAPVFGLKEYTLEINIHGQTREDMWDRVSSILALFSGVAEVETEIDRGKASRRYFKLSLSAVEHEEYGAAKRGWHILKLSCVGYECERERTICLQKSEWEFYFPNANEEWGISREYTFGCDGEQPLTAIVPANLHIKQKLSSNEPVPPGMEGVAAPISAQIKIYGMCRNKAGKEFGPLDIDLLPERHGSIVVGINSVTFNGTTGAVEVEGINAESVRQVGDAPAPILFGFPGQKISLEIIPKYHETIEYYDQLFDISFTYVPVYL